MFGFGNKKKYDSTVYYNEEGQPYHKHRNGSTSLILSDDQVKQASEQASTLADATREQNNQRIREQETLIADPQGAPSAEIALLRQARLLALLERNALSYPPAYRSQTEFAIHAIGQQFIPSLAANPAPMEIAEKFVRTYVEEAQKLAVASKVAGALSNDHMRNDPELLPTFKAALPGLVKELAEHEHFTFAQDRLANDALQLEEGPATRWADSKHVERPSGERTL